MNPPELKRLLQLVESRTAEPIRLRVAFGVCCLERVEHLLSDSEMIETLATGRKFVAGDCGERQLLAAAARAAEIARSHPGSGSLDGTGSAAVSTSHGVAAALAGRALEAAEYAAYASVYAYASHAVTDLSAYDEEHRWQIEKLQALAIDFDKTAAANSAR